MKVNIHNLSSLPDIHIKRIAVALQRSEPVLGSLFWSKRISGLTDVNMFIGDKEININIREYFKFGFKRMRGWFRKKRVKYSDEDVLIFILGKIFKEIELAEDVAHNACQQTKIAFHEFYEAPAPQGLPIKFNIVS